MFDDMLMVTELCSSTAGAVTVTWSRTLPIASLMVSSARHDLARGRLHAVDLPRNLLGRPGRLVGKVLDLGRHDREALPGLAGTCRLDRGVQRQQVDLSGDVLDQPDDAVHRLGGIGQLLRALPGRIRPVERIVGGGARLGHVLGDFVDRRRQFLGTGRDHLNVGRGFVRRHATRSALPTSTVRSPRRSRRSWFDQRLEVCQEFHWA